MDRLAIYRRRLRQPRPDPAAPRRLSVASGQFAVSADPAANARCATRLIDHAADGGADVVHFPECALSGYAGHDFAAWHDYDWAGLIRATDLIRDHGRRRGIWTVIGSSHRLSGEHLPHNCVYVFDDRGELIDRYDKRYCSIRDLDHFTPGDHSVQFAVKGVPCAVLICLEWAFPELFMQCAANGTTCLFLSTSHADTSARLPPQLVGHAWCNQLYISVANTVGRDHFASHWIDPGGHVLGACTLDAEDITINGVPADPEIGAFYDMVRQFRGDLRSGALRDPFLRDDPRSRDRWSL